LATSAAFPNSAEFLLRDRVTVQTIRQNKGSQAGVILLFGQPRHACEREPEGSMVDTGKLVVALSRARHTFWMLVGCQMSGSKPWSNLWTAVKHDIVTWPTHSINIFSCFNGLPQEKKQKQ
jgi:hypothetical protein